MTRNDMDKGPEGDGMDTVKDAGETAPGTFNTKPKKTRRSKKPSLSVLRAVFRATGGIVTTSAAKIGVDDSTVNRWIREDPRIKAAWMEGRDRVVDVAESVLWHWLKAKNLTAAIFTLKCIGWERGWVERHDREEANAESRPREDRESIVNRWIADANVQAATNAVLANMASVVEPTPDNKVN